jgi:hypothetical protein
LKPRLWDIPFIPFEYEPIATTENNNEDGANMKNKKKNQWKKKKSNTALEAKPVEKKDPKKNIGTIAAMDAVDDFDRFEDFFTTNLKLILTSFATAAIIIVIAAIAYFVIESKQNAAADKLLAAKTIPEIEKALKQHPENKAACVAELRLATLKFKAGDKKTALEIYSKLAKSAPAGEPRDRAALNQAYTQEAMNDIDNAIQSFKAVGADLSHPEYIRNEANYSAARLLIAKGDKKNAQNTLKSIDFNKPGFWAAQAQRLIQRTN